MIFGVYSIRDTKSGFLQPTVDVNDLCAIRNFEAAVQAGPQSLFFTHPEDYELFKIGQFDSDSGLISSVSPSEFLISAVSILSRIRNGGDPSAQGQSVRS